MHARRNKGFNEFLRDAVRNNDAEGLKKALSDLNGKERAFVLCRPIFEGKPLLHYSLHEAKEGISNVEAVQEIVNFSTADTLNVPDHEGNYPHTLALEAGKEYALVLLKSQDVDWGISVDNEGNIPYAFAVKNIQFDGNSEIFAQILMRYPDAFDRVNEVGKNILHIACESDDPELLRFCIEKSISRSKDLKLLLEQKNGLGETPLHAAYAIQDNSETSDVLKRYIKENSGRVNVDLSLKDLEKRSVVSTALQVGNRHILDVCKGDFKSEVEGVISLLEYSDIDLLNNYLDSFSPERKDKLIKHSVKELLDHPQRLIRILALEDEDISNKLIEDGQWRQYLAERAPEYMACWLLSGSDRVDELIPGRLPMGRRVSNITGNEEPCQSDAIRSIVSSAICISGGDKNALDRLLNSRKLPKDLQLEARQVLGLINEKTQADSLKLILDKSSPAALEEACFKLAGKDRNGTSIIEKICDSCPSDKIDSLLTSAVRNDIHPGANIPFHGRTALKTEMSHVGIKHAREGNYAKVEGIVKALPHVLYAVDHASDKSILEVAADAGHTPVVRLLIDQHKKVLERDISQDPINQSCNAISSIEEVSKVSAKDAAHMVSEYLSSNGYISHGDAKRILSNSHPTDRSLLIQSLETIYPEISTLSFLKYHSPSEKSTTAAEKYKQPSIPQQIGEKKSLTSGVTGSTTKALKDFGSLQHLASSIKNTIGDATGFKEKVLDSLNNERDFSKTSHKPGSGHNVFTIAAILGTPEQYDALLKRYSDKCSFWTKHPGYSASSHGTALQCAVKAGNSSMARHLLEKCDAEEISIQKGYDKENLLHTIVGSSNLDLLRFLPSASSSSKGSEYSKNVLKAFLEKNAQNKTPLDLALTSGEQHTSALLSFVNSSLKDSEIERLVGSENIVQTAIERGNTLLLGCIFDAESRYNSLVLPSGKKKKGKSSSKQLQVLGNRNYELSLLRDACKSQNPDIAPFLLRKINERIQSSSIDEEEASANISKLSKQALAYLVANNTYHPEVYSNLMELSQAQDPIKNEFFLKGAWKHDNADLIKHIPYQDIAQHLDKSALIKSGKDNLLSYCLENSTPAELENIDQDLKQALVESQGKMKKSRDFYAAWCADAELPAVLSEATLHSAILSGDLNRVKDLIAMDPTLIAKSQAGTAETGGDSNLLPYDFAVKKCANSKKHSELIKYLAKQSIDFALSEATAARGIAGVRADELISQEDWENFSHTVTRILATQGSALELDSMQLANLDGHLRDSASKLFEQSDESPSILRASLSSPKNYRVTSALLRHYLLHHDQLCQQQDPAEVEKIERQVANEINRVEDGHSLLHLAAMHGSYDTLEALLTLGGDKNISTSNGQNIAHLTARSGMLTPTDGEFVFEKLIRENPELNTKDKVGKGLLSYAASCIHPERTVAMLERIIASVPGDTEDRSADGVVLDANLAKYAKNSKKRNEYIKNELNRIDNNRSDNVLGDFLDEYFRDGSTTAAEHALSQLRKITSSSRKNNKKQLPHALERTSERSFTEINPIAGAVRYMSKDRHLLLEQQKKLFSICSQEALSGQDRDILRCVPMEAFTSRNPDYGFSPLDAAIERENIPFIKEILEYRAEELPLNITNQNGDNIVIQLGKMLENPEVLRDKEFLELYKNLLDKSGCSTRSDSGIKAQYVLRNIGGVSGAELRNIADRAEHREVEIGEKFSDAINKVMEEASPNAVQHLSTLTRVYPNHARNAANPFAALLSNILLDKNTETNGISDNARRAIAAFLRDNTLRDTLKNVDAQGNNPLQSALKALVAEVGSPEIGQQRATALLEVCSDVASALEKKHKDLLEEVFLKHKNHEGENFIESLTDVSPSFDIFRTLETKLTPEKISEHSDLNTILARSANQASLQNHICKNYSVFPIGDSDYRGKSRIHKAAVSGDHDAFMSVMVTGGNINLLDQDGNTPLHALLIHMLRNKDSNNIKPGHIETLKTLVAHGAPLHLKNKEGFSVCDLAKSIEHLPSPVKRSMFSFRRKKEDSCVDLVAQAHLQYHDLKEDVKKKVESNITWPSGIEKSTLSFCDLSGSKVALKIGAGGVLTSSKLLQSKVFKENALSSANFDFGDGKDLGSVEKVGNKRNYTVQKGSIKLELSWKPSEGKTQKVQVDVLADGTVKVNDESIRECGAQGEKLNFNNCQVYIGGYSLAEALQRGRWREANQEIETPSPDIDPDGREHGLDRSPSPGNDERRELGAAALDDSIPYTSIPGSDGTALPSHAPSSRTSSISSTIGAGDDDYPAASAGRGQVITVEAEV
ncbi:ankyrin repeat domain-containing protein, partial [Anaplasma phagocytophilum]|uniref:ankyrin repeat domain-containing protein n=1 Tax=Anaplasma phagocytophilum TaxID=948 RepID=UPI000AA716D5